MIANSESRIAWAGALVRRYGLPGAAERLGIHPEDLADALDPDRPRLRQALLDAISELMEADPGLASPINEDAPTDPRHNKTIPLTPYPDEVNFFGRDMAFKAGRWRILRRRANSLPRDGGLPSLSTRENLLKLEIELLRDEGMTLGNDQKHSQAVRSPTIRLREQWEWRERELEKIIAEREALEAKMNRRKLIRRLFSSLTKRTK